MSIKSDRWIREMAEKHAMISPFERGQVKVNAEGGRLLSYGTSSYGYDVRCSREFKVFTNVNSVIVDPKNFDDKCFATVEGDTCIIPPNSFALASTVEYFKIPRDVLTICLGKSSYARCFGGETRVALVDGTSPTLEEMARRAEKGEQFWGYSISSHGQVIVSYLEAPRFIGRDALLEIELDNGTKIRATPDHEFMARDGSMIAAKDLRAEFSLMPLYRSRFRGYEGTFQPMTGHYIATHRLADDWNVRSGIYPAVAGTHRHHVDHNRINNNPWNIERMEASAHLRAHNAISFGPDFDPIEHGRAISDAHQRLMRDPVWCADYIKAQSFRATNFWHEEKYASIREDLLDRRRNPSDATRKKMSDSQALRYKDPYECQKRSELSKEIWARAGNEGRRKRQAEQARGLNLRSEIGAHEVRAALDQAGNLRGAARLLDCDRAVFRRFPDVMAAFAGRAHSNNHKVVAVKEMSGDHDVYCLTVPEAGNFALEAGVFVHNCGIIVNVTPLEPEWEGQVTLEFSNTTPLPARIYAGEGVAQMLFFQSDEPCEVSYKDRGGKYQGQTGITLPSA